MKIIDMYRRAFLRALRKVRSKHGKRGSIQFDVTHSYESFELKREQPVVQAAAKAVESVGLKPKFTICDGGLDANWMFVHGIPTVTLGTGQHEIHTVNEYLDIKQYLASCDMAQLIATAAV
jgi:tripeptide aminopeptidase